MDTVMLLSDEVLDKAAACLKVMAHPVRLKITNLLMTGEFAVHEIAEHCGLPASQTCEHLRLLQGHGLLAAERSGRTVYYKIVSPQLPGLIQCIQNNCTVN